MKIRCKQLLMFALLPFAAAATISCEENDGEKFTPSLPEQAFVLGAEAGSTATATCTFAEAWQVTAGNSAYEITPASGKAGRFELVVKAKKANTDIREKEADLSIKAGKTVKQMYIIQRGTPGIALPATSIDVGADARSREITLDANVSFEVVSDTGWAKIVSVRNSDPVLLKDGKTCSDSLRSTITIGIGKNTDDAPRTAHLKITSAVGDYEIGIRQAAPLKADWNRKFFRRTAIMRFTATWCYNCPGMAKGITMAQEAMPDRIVPMSMHSTTSEGGLAYYQAGKFEKLYTVPGYPSGIANNMARISNDRAIESLAEVVEAVVQEAATSYLARTAIHAYSQIAGNKVKVEADIAVREKDDYKICVFLLESDIIYPQEGDVSDYKHDYVVRAVLTEELFGDPLPASESQQIVRYTVEADIPRSVFNPENLSVVIVTIRPDTPDVQGVSKVTYLDLGTIWDNTAALPANGSVDFKYEQ